MRKHPSQIALGTLLAFALGQPQSFYSSPNPDTLRQTIENPALQSGLEEALRSKSFQPLAAENELRHAVSSGLEEQVKQVQEFRRLVGEVGRILDRQERQGLLGRKISDIHADHFFTESGVAYIPNQKGKVAVFGDRHGDFATLEKELDLFIQETGYDPEKNKNSQEPAYLVFVGDYQDIGKKSLETVTRLLQLKVADPKHVVFLSGNHDLARQNYDTPDFKAHPKDPWLFTQIDEILGDKQAGAKVYDAWNQLVHQMASIVVTANGTVIIHASPPNTTVDQPEFGDRFDLQKGLFNIAQNPNIRTQLSWNFIHRGNTESKTTADNNMKFETPMPDSDWPKGFWISRTDFEQFMKSIGGTILIRGHDSEAPWDWIPYGGRCLTLMGLDYRSPDNGYPVEKRIPARFALFDLSKEYKTIDPNEVLRFAWGKPAAAAGLEEADIRGMLAQAAEAMNGAGVLVVGPETSPAAHGVLEEMLLHGNFRRRMIFFNIDPAWAQHLRMLKTDIRIIPENNLVALMTALKGMPEADQVSVIGLHLAKQLQKQLAENDVQITVVPLQADPMLQLLLFSIGIRAEVLKQIDTEGLDEQIRRRAA